MIRYTLNTASRAWMGLSSRLRSGGVGFQSDLMLLEIPDFDAYWASQRATEQERAERRRLEHSFLGKERKNFQIRGRCWACQQESNFQVDLTRARKVGETWAPNWRETLKCRTCGLNNRLRASLHVFSQKCKPKPGDNIYITEQTTPLFRWLRGRYVSVTGSEYLGDKSPLGQIDERGLRNESLTRLSFADSTFHHILSFDVLEHIPDWQLALSECFRCLKPQGWLMLSVPFLPASELTRVRARIMENGEIEYILPPEYHGDPMTDDGCLCFYHFGWDLLEALSQIGFVSVQATSFWSRKYCYMGGEQLVFFAVKP